MKLPFLTLTLILIAFNNLNAQVSKDSYLFKELKKQDSLFFEKGFNQCDLKFLDTAVHKDLVFYHDKGGKQDRAKFFENVRKNLCADMAKKPIRKVDEQSLEVFALYDNEILYGVIQSGTHRFFTRETGKADVLTGNARFIHLYLLENGRWLLKEVLSYEHK